MLYPILGGLALLTGVGFVAHKKKLEKDAASKTAAQFPGQPAAQAALAKPLAPAVAQVLATRGPPPSTADINSLKVQQAAGTLDLASILKATDGTVFSKTSPPSTAKLPDSIASQILVGDKLTVDVGNAGLQIPSVPTGNMIFLAKGSADMNTRTILAQAIDPRVPDNGPVIGIPIDAITGVEPGS